MKYLKPLIWIAPLLLLAACATPTPKVDVAPGTFTPAQTIAIVEPPEIRTYWLYAPHPGMAFGAIGGAIAGAHMAARAEDIRKLVEQQGLQAHVEIANAFQRELRAAGYEAEIVRAWKMEGDRPAVDFKRIEARYQRVLVLAPTMFGFWAEGLTGNYRPSMRIRATVYGQDRTRLLYDGYHVTGFDPKGEGWVHAAHVATDFTSYEVMVSRPAAMVESLRRGVGEIARSVMLDMRLPSQSAKPMIASAPAPAPAAPASPDMLALSGAWSGPYRCGPYLGTGQVPNPEGWTARAALAVKDGHAVLTRGDASYSETLEGTLVGNDRSAFLQGRGAMNDNRPGGTWRTEASGRFVGEPTALRFEGAVTIRDARGTVTRQCTLQLSRTASA